MPRITLTQPTTTKCYVTYVKNLKVKFVANFGEGTNEYFADLPSPTYLGGTESISSLEHNHKVLFKITLSPDAERHWTVTSLVRQSDNHEFIGTPTLTKYSALDAELL